MSEAEQHPQNAVILIVDDNPGNVKVIMDYLAEYGFQIMVARTGEAGVALAQHDQPDLILLDLMLPGIDGFEVCRRLKADERTRQIPVIFMTILTGVEAKVKGFEAGGVDYIIKPFQAREVLARVTTHLHIRNLTHELQEARASLEHRVEARTAELARANQELQVEIAERKRVEEALRQHRDHLEELVRERTAELVTAKEKAQEAQRRALEAKEAAEAAQRASEAANRAKSEFLAHMSHELRTPLNAILGYAQLLKREKNLTAKQRDQLNTIHSSGKHLVTLISDLLDLSRIETQKMDVELTTFNLPDLLLRSILDTSRLKAEEKSLFVRYEELSPIPAMVKGDGRKLRQVLLNLLDNAVKYTTHGGVTLRVSSQQSPVADNCHLPTANVLFEVEDTGIGISDEQMEAIFEPFTRGDSRPTEGIGLGLAICRRLVELMGGRLSVASEVGKGSTFTVELEVEVVEAVATAEKAPEKTILGYQGARKRLLIVDDNIINFSMLVSVLEPLGFAIETADSGDEALQKAAATRPDLILLDLLMPGMDGDGVLRQIRRTEALEHVKVIGVSAAIADKERTEQFAAACDGFLAKPVDIKELQEQLKEQLRIEWIEEDTEATTAPASAGVPTVDKEEPGKWLPQAVVDDILKKAEWGDFTGLEKILDRLESEDKDYKGFCDRIRAYSKRFDDDAIVAMLRHRGTT